MITAETIDQLTPVQPESIPDTLKAFDQWTVWRTVENQDKPGTFTKLPIDPKTGRNAKSSDPSTWSDFSTAVEYYQSGKADGLMFATTADDGLVLIDLDGCRNPSNGRLSGMAGTCVNYFASYCEISPSGTGLHLIIEGQKPDKRCKNTELDVEVYDKGRFLCITGVHPFGEQKNVEYRQQQLRHSWDRWFPEPEQQKRQVEVKPLPAGIDEQRVIDKIRRSKNAAKVIGLLQGDKSSHGDDWSSCDQALCNHLAFWCDCNPELMDSIFRTSGLMRQKWDNIHDIDGRSYGAMTIENAIAKNSSIYDWSKRGQKKNSKPKPKPKSEPQILSDGEPDDSQPYAELEPEETFSIEEATDRANAELLIQLHGENILYCFPWKSWLIWDNQRWKRDETGQVIKMAYSVSDVLFKRAHDIADDIEKKSCLSHAQRAANARGLESLLKLAQCLVPVTVSELNQDAWLLNCQNGTVDLRTGSIRPHSRDDYQTVICPTVYDPESPSMVWDSFLESTFANHGDVIPFLQRLFGSALVGLVRDHILPVFWGSGANGKSTLLNSILDTLGTDYAMQANPEMLMDSDTERHPTERADLFGKRFISAVETEANKRLKESFVKGLTGGDKIRARFLYKDFFEFDPSHTIVLCSNHKPKVYGDDYGIWRRLRLVPFVETFKGSQADDRLSEKLRNEASGILAWMVQGCLDWQSQGLNEPETVLKATEDYKSESDVVGQFIESECLLGDHYNMKFADFYSEFEEWAEQNGENLPSKTKIGRILNERFHQMPDKRGRWYNGIGLRNK
ncbi:phage/plasmid primase, P4 family [Rubinisphaera sp.]|uniref:phage/plasmid primase, P4 family n=1 Tax=Rubinisphaera sp. TaxID=2024857 RepID=UPI000C0D6FCD|nr:phage/plasmid primase, P4 family [Rubinisphaera sp.]MBV10517.1 hypothetical protein [Rubinisphaera sp.]HCS51755.1 hypothetical protein [Planctomycetaceae bacterium]